MSAIDINNLLLDISADAPSGDDLEYDAAYGKLERAAAGKAEQQMGDTIVEAEEPDWNDVLKQSIALTSRTKDLRILLYLIRAALRTEGYTGLRDGLVLMKNLLENQWRTIYPLLDEEDNDDPTMRINSLSTFCDENAMLQPVRIAPLVRSKMMGTFSLRDYAIAHGDTIPTDSSEAVEMQNVNAAFMDADIEELKETAAAIQESIDTLNSIENFITEQVGTNNSVSLGEIRALLKEAQRCMSGQLELRGITPGTEAPADSEEDTEEMTETSASATTTPNLSGAINSREDVIRALDKIQAYYDLHEPSSPIPLLIARAKNMVNMNFMEILKNLAPDGVSQVETIRGPKES